MTATSVARSIGPVPALWDPDVFVGGAPHEFLAELRRTQPVYWQDMPDEPGFWAVLTHADLTAVAREPVLYSASEGGVVLENLAPDRLEQMRGMLLAMDPPKHVDYRRPLAPSFKARVIGEPRGPDPRHLPRDQRSGARAGRRRVRARRRHAAADPDRGRADGVAQGRLAPDPALGRDEHERPGPRHRRRGERGHRRGLVVRVGWRRHDAHGDLRDAVRRAAPHRGAPRRPHVAHPRQQLRRRPDDRPRFRHLLRAVGHRGQRHHQDDAVVGRARAAPAPRAARRGARRSLAPPGRGRGDPALREPAALLPAHRHRRHRRCTASTSMPATRC